MNLNLKGMGIEAMKKTLLTGLIILLFSAAAANLRAKDPSELPLMEEDAVFWEELLKETGIRNKNLLYASYVAYRDQLNDLSMESFKECLKQNPGNEMLTGIILYYMGNNQYKLGRNRESLASFNRIFRLKMGKFENIKLAAKINMALAYLKAGDRTRSRILLQSVVDSDKSKDSRYRNRASALLKNIK